MKTKLNIDYQKLVETRYKLIKKIGEGGMSYIFLANDVIRKKKVAIKFMKEQDNNLDFQKFKYRMMQEVQSLSQIKSNNITEIYDFNFKTKLPYFVMEYVEGNTLNNQIKKHGQFGELAALKIIEIILKTLFYLHKNGKIHRDLTTRNIIIQRNGNIKLLDFGIVSGVLAKKNSNFQLTEENAVIGTISYVSPEQLTSEKASFLSDFYSVGLILFELLTGISAFPPGQFNNSPNMSKTQIYEKLCTKIIKEGCPDVQRFNPNVSNNVAYIVKKATQILPKHRFQTITEFLKHIAYAKHKLLQQKTQIKNNISNKSLNKKSKFNSKNSGLNKINQEKFHLFNFICKLFQFFFKNKE